MRPLDPIKQEKILRAVIDLAGQQGLSGVNINAISKASGLGVGSIYTYFNGKEELIQAAYAYAEDKVTDMIYKGHDPKGPVKDAFKRIYINTLNYRLKHHNETVFIDQYISSNLVQLNLEKQVKEFELQNKPLYDIIARGQQDGIIANNAAFIIINFINGAIRASANGMAQKLIPLNKKSIDACFLMVWKGISQ